MMPNTPDAQELLAAAHAVAVSSLSKVETFQLAGRTATRLIVQVRDNAEGVRLLDELAWRYARHLEIVGLAHQFRAQASQEVSRTGGLVEEAIGRLIRGYVRAHVRYTPEEEETFRSPLVTLGIGEGDCDDQALVVATIARAADVPARILGVRNRQGDITHVCTQLFHGGRWHWVETTVDAFYGEPPLVAAARLLPKGRADLTS